MRFGRWAAAVAAMVLAGQAQAATWIAYRVVGTGQQFSEDVNGSNPTYRNGDFAFTFVAEVDPNFSAGFGQNLTGADFTYYDPNASSERGENLEVKVGTPGTLTFTQNNSGYLSKNYNLNVTAPFILSTLPSLQQSSAATGSLRFSIFGASAAGVSITGNVARFDILGPVSGFQTPFVTFLPESATWGLMILGFGLVGAALRRRRVSQQQAIA